MSISVLDVPYTVLFKLKANDKSLANCDGYCDTSIKRIVVREYTAAERQEPLSLGSLDAYKHKCLRHELVHAFLYESGLSINGADVDQWPTNEEMVDWMAIQGPKIYAAWQAAKCL